jgi:hypothetical protein
MPRMYVPDITLRDCSSSPGQPEEMIHHKKGMRVVRDAVNFSFSKERDGAGLATGASSCRAPVATAIQQVK